MSATRPRLRAEERRQAVLDAALPRLLRVELPRRDDGRDRPRGRRSPSRSSTGTSARSATSTSRASTRPGAASASSPRRRSRTNPAGCLGADRRRLHGEAARLRLVDLWIQALTEAGDDAVIAKAVRAADPRGARLLRRRDPPRPGARRGHPDRDPVAEAWIFIAGGLLATIDHRLGGLLGDDLDRVRASRRAWMAPTRSHGRNRDAASRKSPGCGTRGPFWSGGAPVEAPRKRRLCGPASPPVDVPRRSPCTTTGRPVACKVTSL